MSKEIFISSTPHETRLAIVENDALTEIYYERENEYTLAGSIYNGKVTRVLPGMQSAFVDIGLERDAFLYITDFMEEAGEGEDFEAHANGGDQSRAPRLEGGRESGGREGGGRDGGGRDGGGRGEGRRQDRGGRGDRDSQRSAAPADREPSDAELFTEAVAGLDPVRSQTIEGERADRSGGRRGGRGRRTNSDGIRPERSDNSQSNSQSSSQSGEQTPSGTRFEQPVEQAGNIAIPDAPADLGEGAPGADGSRRWRGRRGRRGNRGGAARDQARMAAAPEAPPAVDGPDGPGVPFYSANSNAYAEEQGMDFEAAAEVEEAQSSQAVSGEASFPERGGDRASGDRASGERASGDRASGDRASGDRGPRDRSQHDAGQRAPRGFAPRPDRQAGNSGAAADAPAPYGVESYTEAPVEPMILPGESLSKYRGDAPAAGSSAASSAPDAPKVELPEFRVEGWDGGAVLPGETLRRREPSTSEARTGSRSEDRGDHGGRGFRDERGRGRNERPQQAGREQREERTSASFEPASSPAYSASEIAPGIAPAASEELHQQNAQHTSEPVFAAEAHTDQHPAEPASSLAHDPETPAEDLLPAPSAATREDEPETLSASHTITPLVAMNSTFVAPPPPPMPAAEIEPAPHAEEHPQAAPSVEAETHQAELEHNDPLAAAAPEHIDHAEPAEPVFTEVEHEYEPSEAAASYRIDPAAPSEFRQSGGAVDDSIQEIDEHHEQAAPAHEFTSITDTGEMHSEAVVPAVEMPSELAPAEIASPAISQPEAGSGFSSAPHFAPGSGLLEEEEMLDDEDDLDTSVHAGRVDGLEAQHASHGDESQQDSQEQETLEGAADLGVMLREMSIDQITRTEPALDEDDDEEDFLEEDQDYEFDESESEEDEFGDDGDADESGEQVPELGESEETLDRAAFGGDFGSDREQTGERGDSSAGAAPQGLAGDPSGEPRSNSHRDDGHRDDGRRDDGRRREGRRGDRNRRPGSGDRNADRSVSTSERSPERSSSERSGGERSSGERSGGERGRRDGGRGRMSMQSTNLPAISDLLKPGQEILCQIAKEPIAKKGARITSHIALPGRFLVFMPTVNHTGVSRKIESDGERRRLKEILLSEKGEASGGFIVRTAAAGATEEELRSDLRFLLNLWTDIKQRSEASKSPALIYHDLNLVERVLRDQVTDTFSAIWVDTESEYERVLRFLQRFQPSLIRRVKLYTKELPLFEQFGITEEINKALRSKVWLKSGGSIVINQTEALVAIDINTGKYVGKTARLEDTIVKTNLDAIPEIVRQIRLRDLGGIIIIDFIDMDERKNRNKVMAALEEELKSDRAPSKVLQFNDFGLVAITRKRVKQSLERTLSTTCTICQGTGMTKSPVTVCNDIYIEMRKMQKHLDRGDVMLRVHPDVVKQLKAPSTHWLQEMEEMVGKTILVKSDPGLHPEQFDIH